MGELPINWDNAVHFRQSCAPTRRTQWQDATNSFTVEEYAGSPHANVTIEFWEQGQPIRHYLRFGKHVRYDKHVIQERHPVIDMLIAYFKAPKEVLPCLQCLGKLEVCLKTGKTPKECHKHYRGWKCKLKPCPACYVPSTGECTGSRSGLGCTYKGDCQQLWAA